MTGSSHNARRALAQERDEARRQRALARHAYREAVDASRLPPLARLLLRCLLDHGLVCHPSQERLARMSGMSKSTLIRQLRTVQLAGWVEHTRKRAAGGRLGGNVYRLRVPPGVRVIPGPGLRDDASQVSERHLLNESPVGNTKRAGAEITPACWSWPAWLDWLQAAGRADLRDEALKRGALSVPALHPGAFPAGRVPLPIVPEDSP